ncbi:energy-coupling factor transporter transmembrane component T family protein [Bacillus alkalicellulosilyticus]|uniref:energy-coupling factor transporter transmembrane component T family protein n=1 Tax=Alkalihalobacterium alkalicellulosilyticum TaxID=1912214 RepID=UPI00099711E3|nr:energy-coupling factor transporter transmembrane component T [Bacillus alkalicellulosilyticus]
MFQHVIVGQYVKGHSIFHQMDPRSKLIAIFLLVLIVFLANNWLSYFVLIIFALLSIIISQVPLLYIYKGLKPIFLIIVFTMLMHLILNKEGAVVLEMGPFSVYESGITQGVFIALRLLIIVVLTSLLTLTTKPLDLTDGLEFLLQPLTRFRVPAHEIALMMSISLRFIPTLLQETEKILKAQMARGVDFSSGSIMQRMKAVIPLLIPLFISAFKRAEDLALAMESRGYRGGEGRTKLRELEWRKKDTSVLFIVCLFGFGLFLLRI